MSEVLKIDSLSDNSTINLALDTINKRKQALVFANTKRSAEKTAEDISKKIKSEGKELVKLSEDILHSLTRPTKQCERLSRCIKKGVAFHHSGLVQKQRGLIEENFRDGLIKVICSTPTLCLSKDTLIWHDMSETEASKFKSSNPLFVLSKNKLISMKAQKVNKIVNISKLIQISLVSGYSIKITPNHKMLIKRKNKKEALQAKNIKKTDKIATIGRLNISKTSITHIKDFIIDNKIDIPNYKFGPKLSYFIGIMLGDGYSGAETINGKLKYKGSPSIVGIDNEIFLQIQEFCNQLKLSCKKTQTSHGTPQLVLGKNKWFREFLARCGVEKGTRKHISNRLMEMNSENSASLLKGLFDTDGYVDKQMGPGFSNTSEELIKQTQKLLLRFGIVSTIRTKKAGSMKIYEKEYKTLPCFELNIHQKKSIIDFYKYIGFNIKRKQEDLINKVAKIFSNLNYVSCDNCNYKIYRDLLSGRTKDQKLWGKTKLRVINLLGEKGELGSRELKRILHNEPKKKDSRLNHHYELIKKRRIGSRSTTEWFWSLNGIGKWIYNHILNKNKRIDEFFRNQKCPLCNNELGWIVKRGWRDSDFEGDLFWDKIREIKEVEVEEDVYDIVLPNKPNNSHMFVANGFIVHNSMGLDLPAFRTIIRDLRRYGPRGLTYIPVLEYLQMAGRAGRPNFDKEGQAIIIAASDGDKKKLKEKYIDGSPEDIYSKLAVEPVLRTYVLSLIASNFVNTKKEIFDFFGKTFWAFQFADTFELQQIVEKMLNLLGEWEFLKGDKEEFASADELMDERYRATLLGKRVAELYIDPLTAHNFILSLRKATGKKTVSFSFLQMISSSLELRPLLRVKVKEHDKIEEELVKYGGFLLSEEPSMYEEEYGYFLNSVKTTLFFLEWINEKDDEYLLENYDIRPGEIRAKLNIADWLLYAAEELARILKFQPLLKDLVRLRIRVKNGVREELIPLLKLGQVGRVRARKLYYNKIKTIGDVREADFVKLVQILGRKVALNVKKQVGQDFEKIKVKENKRKGQISLEDYNE